MQIILVQAEVEQAIKDYIANRVTLAEGTEIAIDLKAGRGPEGFTASIDIVPATAKTIPAGQVKRAVAPKAVEATEKATETSAATQASVESETVVQEADSPQETASSESTDGANAENSTAETASGDTEEAAPAPVRSLFAGLKKPVNG